VKKGAIQVDLYTCTLSAYDTDGYLTVQGDYYGEKGGQQHEAIFPLGIQARPLDPVTDTTGAVGAGCPMLTFWEADQAMMMPFGDSRTVAGLPALDKGDAMLHGLKAPNFLRMQQEGTCTLYTTTTGTSTGQIVSMTHAPTGMQRIGPWGKETFDQYGYHLRTFSEARIDLGGISGIQIPGVDLNSYATLTAATVSLRGRLVSLGPGGAAQPIALSGPILTLAAAVQASLIATNALAAAAVPTAASVAAATAATAALAALAAALGVATAAIPSQSTVAT
jgi:hypothetical protein